MRKSLAALIGVITVGVVGVDVAGLSGAFGYPKYDAGASSIPTRTSTSSTSGKHHSTPPSTPPSSSTPTGPPPSSSSTAPSSTLSQSSVGHSPKSIFSIPPAIPVPPGAIPTAPIGNGADVTTIGDSVMVDAQPYLEQLLPGIVVDGKVSRQLIQTPPVVSHLKATGQLHRYVVIELGTNGPYSASQLKGLMKQIGPHHGFVLVNTSDPLPWEQAANQVIDQVAASYPHTVLVNWYQAAQKIPPQDFYADHVHLVPAGAKYFATLIAQAVLKLQKEYRPPGQ